MNPDLAQSPLQYASAIARYISDPSTIRARTIDSWGRAPSVDECRNLRAAAINERNEFSRYWEARSTELKDRYTPDNYPCGHERSMENTWHKGDREACRECFELRRGVIARRLAVSQMFQVPEVVAEKSARPEDLIPMTFGPARRVLLLAGMLFDMPTEKITGRSRDRKIVRARWAVIYTLRQTMGWSMSRAGEFVGLTDHTTVRYALKQAPIFMARDERFAEICQRLAAITSVEVPKVADDLVDALMREAA